jgi:dolichol-phosphate mannosyltransferase
MQNPLNGRDRSITTRLNRAQGTMNSTTLAPQKVSVHDREQALFAHDPNVVTRLADPNLIESPLDLGTVFVVLPAYNEAEGLPSLLERVQRVFAENNRSYHVIVVDDASSDDTPDIAVEYSQRMPVTLVQHIENQNLPGALRSGLTAAVGLAKEGDVIVTMDGDDTHPPAFINPLLQKIQEGYDVVTASRYQPGSRVVGVPRFRVLMTYGAKLLFQTIMPIPGVRDYTCGYRAYRFNVLQETMEHYGEEFVSEKGFSCMADVLLKMRKFKYVFGEVPFLLRYDQKQGLSKMNVGRTVSMSLKLLLKRRFGGY